MQLACHDSNADHSFNEAGRIRLIGGIPIVGTCFVLVTTKKYCSRLLVAQIIKSRVNYEDHSVDSLIKTEVLLFEGAQPFHCEIIRDLANGANTTIAKQDYITALARGQLDTTAFKVI